MLIHATRVFAISEDSHSLRLTSKLVDLRSGYANRFSCASRAKTRPNRWYQPKRNQKRTPKKVSFAFGAATRIRTGDLILTKDVLYQLSHSSISQNISHDALYYIK